MRDTPIVGERGLALAEVVVGDAGMRGKNAVGSSPLLKVDGLHLARSEGTVRRVIVADRVRTSAAAPVTAGVDHQDGVLIHPMRPIAMVQVHDALT